MTGTCRRIETLGSFKVIVCGPENTSLKVCVGQQGKTAEGGVSKSHSQLGSDARNQDVKSREEAECVREEVVLIVELLDLVVEGMLMSAGCLGRHIVRKVGMTGKLQDEIEKDGHIDKTKM